MKYKKIIENLKNDLSKLSSEHELNNVKSKYLGKKSEIQKGFMGLSNLSGAERSKSGKLLNNLKLQIEELIKQAHKNIILNKKYQPIDVSRPGISLSNISKIGHLHPVTQVLDETYKIFTELGFAIVDSPEIETDWFNFEALNMPESHPAREMQDTFYVEGTNRKLLPRTHTSGMQVRFMLENEPPYKIIVPGKVFRNEDEDATHSWAFNQVEGLVVGEGVSMADLKGTLMRVIKRQLGDEATIRFRPSYFPYTEPSVEIDVKYNGSWLELGGAGMVHPDVLTNGGVDPEKYSGFAFGWGIERIAVAKYSINDLRQLWRPKINYLEQF